jgi:NADH dehydrogenase
MNVVVLGGTGFVGRHLVPRLAAAGHRVCVLSRNRERHRELAVLPGVTLVSVDPYSVEALAPRLRGADAVINLVGILNEPGFGGRGFRRAHVELARTLIAAMQRAAVTRLLQVSALNAGQGASWYLKSKGEAEALVRGSGLDWTILRPSVIFGEGDGLFCRFARLLALVPVLPLARARTRFAPVYVGDVAAACLRCLAHEATRGQTFELGGPRTLTLAEIVRYARDAAGRRRVVLPLPDALGRMQALALDFVPGKPFSSDNFKSLALDAVPASDGLAALGVSATPVEAVVPRLLRHSETRQGHLDRLRQRREI